MAAHNCDHDWIPCGSDPDHFYPQATMDVCVECGALRVVLRLDLGGRVYIFRPDATTTDPD